jgi:hypothetical protein
MKNLLLVITLTACLPSLAQKKVKTLEVSDTIIYATVDRPGDVYLVTLHGQIQKFDKDGKLIIVFRHKGAPTLFDPRDGARLFAYYRENQEYDYYNPSFEVTASFRIDPAFAIQPVLICPSGDHKLWVLDGEDHSLKKLNAKQDEVEVEVTIDSLQHASDISTIREYQGFVFILNPKKGIFIFNGLGRHIRTIEEHGVHHFNFLGEELYYMKGNQLKLFNLFTAESRTIAQQKPSKIVLLTDERLFVINHLSLEIFEFSP